MKRGFLNSSKAKARPLGPTHVLASKPLTTQSRTSSPESDSDSSLTFSPVWDGPAEPVRRLPIGKVERVAFPDGYEPEEHDPRSNTIHGMVFTTLPQITDPTSDEPVTECLFFPGSKEVFTGIPGFPHPMVQPAAPAFKLDKVPGKGMGLFATRALPAGELILSERPLFLSPVGFEVLARPNFNFAQYTQRLLMESEKSVAMSVDRMRPESKAAFMALANSHLEDGSGPCLGIVRTNGLGVSGLRPGVKGLRSKYGAIPQYISRLNHSCSPNTSPRFDKGSLSYRLWAVRDIAEGEELTFQYTDVICAAEARQKDLKPYAFTCTCPACTDAPASDERRAAIAGFTPTVVVWAVNRELSDDWLLKKTAEKLALMDIEGLQHCTEYWEATHAMMDTYIALGDTHNASKWAAKLLPQVWADKYDKAKIVPLLDPANTAAYEAYYTWRMRVGGARPGSVGQIFQQMAALAGPNGFKTLGNGTGFFMLPGPGGPLPPGFPSL
ncbi:hypothetical protein C8R47DRAFT_1121704 [Mycena vitilis]|nr:hypothetical protein C8R47DRAFT_1121704 [Mycena vitilis]